MKGHIPVICCLPHARERVATGERESRAVVGRWMVDHGFATGHGDTLDDLLSELAWQVDELQARLHDDVEASS